MIPLELENSNVKKNRHTEEQIIAILREAEVPGAEIRAVVRKHNITEQAFYRWRNKYGGMEVSECNDPAIPAQVMPLMRKPQRAFSTDEVSRCFRR